MAFVSEEITKEEDKSYFNSLALTGMTGDLLSPGWWTIDREKNIILYERGGGSFEVPVGYGLYIGGDIIKMEVGETSEGDRYDGDLKMYYFIKKIEIPINLIRRGYEVDSIKRIIKEAFCTMGVPYVERKNILEVNVKIVVEPEIV